MTTATTPVEHPPWCEPTRCPAEPASGEPFTATPLSASMAGPSSPRRSPPMTRAPRACSSRFATATTYRGTGWKPWRGRSPLRPRDCTTAADSNYAAHGSTPNTPGMELCVSLPVTGGCSWPARYGPNHERGMVRCHRCSDRRVGWSCAGACQPTEREPSASKSRSSADCERRRRSRRCTRTCRGQGHGSRIESASRTRPD